MVAAGCAGAYHPLDSIDLADGTSTAGLCKNCVLRESSVEG